MAITNKNDISLLLAVWLLADFYDYEAGKGSDKPYLSATTLMRPTKQIILGQRIPIEDRRDEDVEDYIARALGHTIHDGIEQAWVKQGKRNLTKLGFPANMVENLKINPTDEEVRADPNIIPVYLEQRLYREIDGYVIGGKFDAIVDGRIEDAKSTSVWAYIFGSRDDEHTLQLSLYKWLDAGQELPKIHEDYGRINYVFTDWQKAEARRQPDRYPQRRTHHKDLILEEPDKTELWVRQKLADLKKYLNKSESEIPKCTPEELWQGDTEYKYYKDPAKANTPGARSTKNFGTDLAAANRFMVEQGGVGIVKAFPGIPKRCPYCPGFDICNQRKDYYDDEGNPK